MTPPPPTPAGKPRSAARAAAGRPVLPLVPGFDRAPARSRPLPDAAAVRLLAAPDSAPPYDDAPVAARHPSRASGAVASGERPGCCEPAGRTRTPPAREPGPGGERRGPGGERRGPGAAAGWPSQFAQVLAETLAGSRPQGQITPWTTNQARRLIRQLGPLLASGTAPRVRRVMTSRPAPGVVEMTVVVGCGPAIRALAVRLERDQPPRERSGYEPTGKWICTAVEAA